MSDYVRWHIDSHSEFLFAMPIEQLTPLVPAPLEVVEPQPGVGLVWVGCIRFAAGNIDVLPAFHEVAWSVIVQPRAVDGGECPDYATFTVRIASDCARFDDWTRRVDRMTVMDCPGLRAQVDRAHASYSVQDDRGPIVTLTTSPASSASEVEWREGLVKVQVFTQDSEGLWGGWVEWFGSYADDEGPGHPDTRLFSHPFFGELDVDAARCVRQMYTAPSGTAVMKYYAPRRLRLAASTGFR